MDRIVNMLIRMLLRKGVNHLAKRGSKGQGGGGQGSAERQNAKRAQQALRAGRKIGRF